MTVEGKRALIAEIQALVVRTNSPQPRRVTNGVDSSRVAMLLAVLERRAGISLIDKDVYVSTVGGMRILEPAADLAIAVAIASAVTDKPVRSSVAAFGEISLAGEIRGVSNSKQRHAEAEDSATTRLSVPRVISCLRLCPKLLVEQELDSVLGVNPVNFYLQKVGSAICRHSLLLSPTTCR